MRKLFNLAATCVVAYAAINGISNQFKPDAARIASQEKSIFPALGFDDDRQNVPISLGYHAEKNGQKILYLPEGPVSKIYLYWKELATQTLARSGNDDFQSWEEEVQTQYLRKMYKLLGAMPDSCYVYLKLCPEGIPFVKAANDLN